MTYNAVDIAWAAGFFEGEGCFSSTGGKRPAPDASVCGTDKETIDKFHQIMGFGTLTVADKSKYGWKTMYTWHAHGFEKFQATVAILWPHLSPRRKKRIQELMADVKQYWLGGDGRRGRYKRTPKQLRSDRKTCPQCGLTKNKKNFGKNKAEKDGYKCYCKDCRKVGGK
ncbi:MAG: hypothetical protein KOO63_03860 [Bacteroidales bacterium]|nr:hypothetical protein [Candidatus Latescibacterota bacterium]